ncbi:GGDEF domain-containing protein [Aquisalimonas asiatica]|uniref:diguanylate cyclase n=1 Tax=Aquisalimonas asiatica TaxID=406100 RepID=A0A1H8QVL1_9GAMM|nr:GGDEF domain-containing protein [Aquisalimonas asiatica]SEO58299.1 diguanylate cyclase (GGDEF) domain-containing protein [Aquisalimonas asiatica]
MVDQPATNQPSAFDSSSPSPYAIDRLRARFSDPETERAFRASEAGTTRRHLRVALAAWAFLVMLFAIPDYVALNGTGTAFYSLMAMRVATTALVLVFVALTFWRPQLCEHDGALAALQAVGISGFFLVYLMRPDVAPYNVATTLVMIIGLYLLLPNLLTWASALAAYLAVGSLISIRVVLDVNATELVSVGILLSLPIIVGLLVAHRLQMLRRRQFALLAKTRATNAELADEVKWRRRLERELERQAGTDLLTGVYNRRGYEPLLARAFERVKRHGGDLAVAVLDLDHFKALNDTHGHDAGDQVLQHLAQQWQSALRATDIVGRLGGEEFVVIMPDTTLESAVESMEQLRAMAASASVTVADHALHVTMTVGVTANRPHDSGFNDLLRRADNALYRGKEAGRNRVVRDDGATA